MQHTLEREDARLIVKIDNKEPIELVDLTKSLLSLASQFSTYTEQYGHSKEEKEAKLYVKEIRQGSVIVELFEMATIGILPFMENCNTIVDFAKFFKTTCEYLLTGNGDKPELTQSDYKELSAIVNPIAKDKASQMNVSTTINGNVVFNFNLDSTQSNAIQNIIKEEIEKSKLPSTQDDIITKVVLTWFQARGNIKSKSGNKAVIEEVSKKELNVIFEDETTKEKVLHSDINPFTTAFVVDVKIITVQNKPAIYKILKLPEYFDLEN